MSVMCDVRETDTERDHADARLTDGEAWTEGVDYCTLLVRYIVHALASALAYTIAFNTEVTVLSTHH